VDLDNVPVRWWRKKPYILREGELDPDAMEASKIKTVYVPRIGETD
jgi:hypothetical protein